MFAVLVEYIVEVVAALVEDIVEVVEQLHHCCTQQEITVVGQVGYLPEIFVEAADTTVVFQVDYFLVRFVEAAKVAAGTVEQFVPIDKFDTDLVVVLVVVRAVCTKILVSQVEAVAQFAKVADNTVALIEAIRLVELQ